MLRKTVLKNGCGLGNCYVVENNSPTYFDWELAFTIVNIKQNLYGCQKEQTVLWRNPKLLQTDSGFSIGGNNFLRLDLFKALFLVYCLVVVIMWNFFSLDFVCYIAFWVILKLVLCFLKNLEKIFSKLKLKVGLF